MSKSSRRIFPLIFLLTLAAGLGLASSYVAPAAVLGQTASATTTLSTTATTTFTSRSSSFTSTKTLSVTNATSVTVFTGTRTTGVTSLIVVTATTSAIITSTTVSTSTTSVVSLPSSNPSCAVAEVSAGSALAPYANSLRQFRSQILKTSAGRAFMSAFNSWYYSWAPLVAAAAENHAFADIIRVGLVPMFGILYAARYSYLAAAPFSPEAGALAAGIVAASLLGIVYVAPITYAFARALRLRKYLLALHRIRATPLALWTVGSLLLILAAYLLGSFTLMAVATANLVLSMLTFGSIIGIRALASAKPPIINPAPILAIRVFKRKLA